MHLRDLALKLRALVAPRRVERDLDEELAFHIDREMQKHIAAGLSPVDARTRALARFGSVPLAADQCRDARGTGLVDDLSRDIRYAVRAFRRAPLAAMTVVATVALGLGLVAAVFGIYNFFMLRVDAVQNPGQLFAVALEQRMGPDGERTIALTRRDYDAMRRETSVFTDAFARLDYAYAGPVEGRVARAALVTGNFFQVLGVQATLGRPLLPEDDARDAGRPVIVLSHVGWQKVLRGDSAAIGRHVVINGTSFEIVGVMPDGFRGLGVTPPDYWAPLALARHFRDDLAGQPDEVAAEVVGRLKPEVSREAARAALAAWASGRAELEKHPAQQVQVWLTPRQGTLSAEDTETQLMFAPLFLAFGLILLIGCANVANLLLARGLSRQREIGVRLSLGASRRRIIRQLLTESLLLALAAAVCALLVSRLFLDGALMAVMRSIPPDFAPLVSLLNLAAPAADWRLLIFLVAGASLSTVLFGLAPALQTTRLDLVRTMRGEVTRDARPRRARGALIAVQVGASAVLLISAAIFLRGAFAAATRDPGMRTSDTLRVSIENEARRIANLETLRADPLVSLVAAASPATRGVVETTVSPVSVSVDQRAVSSDYFTVLGVDLLSGRGFTPSERTADAGVVVLSQSLARQLWPGGGGLGEVVRLQTPPSASPDEPSRSGSAPSAQVVASRTLTVVGIARDPGRASRTSHLVYLPTVPESPGTELLLRVRGNPDQARLALLERLKGIDGAFGVMTLRAMVGMQAYLLQILFALTVFLGGLALVLTVSGLFSVLSYLIEQQAKEIGVRMALGAATKHIAQLLLFQSLRPVGIGLGAGAGLAAVVAIVLMTTSLAAEIGDSVDVADPVAYAASAVVIAAACAIAVFVPTLRAANIDPMATLRKD